MHNLSLVEACYRKFVKDISKWLPEDIVYVDLELLQKLDLLHYHDPEFNDPNLTRYFHVIETDEKITLINDEFIVWIIPEKFDELPVTYSLIALNTPRGPELKMCFVTSGVYNSSRLVLRVLEKLLEEIQENEDLVNKLQSK